jgi:hypothetical protein
MATTNVVYAEPIFHLVAMAKPAKIKKPLLKNQERA